MLFLLYVLGVSKFKRMLKLINGDVEIFLRKLMYYSLILVQFVITQKKEYSAS